MGRVTSLDEEKWLKKKLSNFKLLLAAVLWKLNSVKLLSLYSIIQKIPQPCRQVIELIR